MFVLKKETQLFLLLEFLLDVLVAFTVRRLLLCWGCGLHSKELVSLLKVVPSNLRLIPFNYSLYGSEHVVSMAFIEGNVKQAVVTHSYGVRRREYRVPIVKKVVTNRRTRVPRIPQKVPARLYSFTIGAFSTIAC